MKVLFIIAFLFTLATSLYFGYLGRTVEMGMAVVAGSIAMAFANLDKIKRFKGAGFEAETKQVIQEANVTIASLRKLATQIVEPTLTIIGREGQPFQNISNAEKFEIKERLVKTLKELQANEEKIEKVTAKFDDSFIIEHGRNILGLINRNEKIDKSTKEEIKTLISTENLNTINPQKIRNFLKARDLLTKEIDEAIEDYEYFVKNKKFRRSEYWPV